MRARPTTLHEKQRKLLRGGEVSSRRGKEKGEEDERVDAGEVVAHPEEGPHRLYYTLGAP